jgi:anti-repressor protein
MSNLANELPLIHHKDCAYFSGHDVFAVYSPSRTYGAWLKQVTDQNRLLKGQDFLVDDDRVTAYSQANEDTADHLLTPAAVLKINKKADSPMCVPMIRHVNALTELKPAAAAPLTQISLADQAPLAQPAPQRQLRDWTTFMFNGSPIRVFNRQNDIWMVVKDICTACGLSNLRYPLADVDYEMKARFSIPTGRTEQVASLVNVKGLIRLNELSRKTNLQPLCDYILTADLVFPEIEEAPAVVVPEVVVAEKTITIVSGEKVKLFNNPEYGDIEILTQDNEELFAATNLAQILNYTNPHEAIRTHCLRARSISVLTAGGMQTKNFIPESDVWRLVIRSNLPKAREVEKWIFEEVLPSIRKNGFYMTENKVTDILNDPDAFIAVLVAYKEERVKRLMAEEVIQVNEPKVIYAEQLLSSPDAIDMKQMSNLMTNKLKVKIGRNILFGWLRSEKILDAKNAPYQKYLDRGYFQVTQISKSMKTKNTNFQVTMVLPIGQQYIINRYRRYMDDLNGY